MTCTAMLGNGTRICMAIILPKLNPTPWGHQKGFIRSYEVAGGISMPEVAGQRAAVSTGLVTGNFS